MIIRPQLPDDATAIRDILLSAFRGEQEADLVDGLRLGNDFVLSMVAEQEGQGPVGFIGFSRVWIGQARWPGISLAPLAVAREYRRRGVGRALVEAGHARLQESGETIIFVLGDPAYYGRFKYSIATAATFDCVFAGQYFQALRLSPLAPQSGTITYAPAFDDLG